MIFNIYVYNTKGDCVYYREWYRYPNSVLKMSQEEHFKLVYGMLFSLKSFVRRITPARGDGTRLPVQNEEFYYYTTSAYKFNLYETVSGLKFILCTDPSVGDVREVLHQLYRDVYVDCVALNVLATPPTGIPAEGGDEQEESPYRNVIYSELFTRRLDVFIRSLPFFVEAPPGMRLLEGASAGPPGGGGGAAASPGTGR
eukprot:Nk52_evm1s1260 gene=Nk52_evmTU1s1260